MLLLTLARKEMEKQRKEEYTLQQVHICIVFLLLACFVACLLACLPACRADRAYPSRLRIDRFTERLQVESYIVTTTCQFEYDAQTLFTIAV